MDLDIKEKKKASGNEELGVFLSCDFTDDKPKNKAKQLNPKFKIFREFTLVTLSALSEIKADLFGKDRDAISSQVKVSALDAVACAGVCGIQWKKNLSGSVHVTISDQDDITLAANNVAANAVKSTELKINSFPIFSPANIVQEEGEVHICHVNPRTLMTLEAFNFIYLNPTKRFSTYIEPALSSLTNNGMLSITCPDVSLFARSPHLVKRYYGASVVKTEYLKELSARIIIADIARCAARCDKGITVNYVVLHEDSLLICVTVSRGHAASDSSVANVGQLLHCRLCEQRNFLPEQLAPLDDPYSHLQCTCKEKNPGKTAVVLGPLWKGPIFEKSFLDLLKKHGEKFQISSKFFETVNFLLAESCCSAAEHTDSGDNHQASANSCNTQPLVNNGDHAPESSTLKRKAEELPCITTKRQKIKAAVSSSDPGNVPFYYNISKFRRTNIPKLDKLVTILRCQGYKASRTHFDHSAIRTSANVHQFLSILS